jgi:putative DNA primase/helicase
VNHPNPSCLSNELPDSGSCTASPLLTNASDPKPGAGDGLPVICIQQKRLPEALAAAAHAMAAHNQPPTLFDHQGELVKLVLAQGQPPRLMPLKPADLQCELTYAAHWFELTDKGQKAIYPPPLLVSAMMRRLTGWAPPLRQLIGAPVFGENWRLINAPGYDAQNQVYYHPDHALLPPIPSQPDVQTVAEAVSLIRDELLGDFPFASSADRAAAIACLILPLIRNRIEGATPLHLIDSPSPGSGKTLLADILCIPALGKEPPATTEVANADDLRKSVTALALAGEPVVLIDNINARLQGSALAAALTKVEWADRIVGTSRLARGAMKAVWIGTGNNIAMSAELSRRVVRCRIDAGVPQPHLRSGFRHPDLRNWAKAQRPRLLWAILTLVRNWLSSGMPEGPITLGSYESYCRMVGGILHAAGIEGFLANLHTEQGHGDDESVEWEAFVGAWHQALGEQVVGAQELDKVVLTPNPEMLSLTLASTHSSRGVRIKLGQELRKRRDAVIGGWRIKVSGGVDRHGCWHYHLGSVCGTAQP